MLTCVQVAIVQIYFQVIQVWSLMLKKGEDHSNHLVLISHFQECNPSKAHFLPEVNVLVPSPVPRSIVERELPLSPKQIQVTKISQRCSEESKKFIILSSLNLMDSGKLRKCKLNVYSSLQSLSFPCTIHA